MHDGGMTAISSTGSKPRWVRDRIFALLTANVAMAFALAGWYEAEIRVLPVNSARVLDLRMLETEARIKASRPALRDDNASKQEPGPKEKSETIQRQMAVTAVIGYAWKYMMYLVAIILEGLAITSVLREGGRWPQLAAGVLILASTAATLVGMSLLMNPNYGGMEPLRHLSYFYAGLIQGGYGVVLLVAFLPSAGPRRN